MVDKQKKDNNNTMERLRADMKKEVSSAVKTPQDRVVYQDWMEKVARPAVGGTIGLLRQSCLSGLDG